MFPHVPASKKWIYTKTEVNYLTVLTMVCHHTQPLPSWVEPAQAGYSIDLSVLRDLATDTADWHYTVDETVDIGALCQQPINHIQHK